jgi:hypothetical protein
MFSRHLAAPLEAAGFSATPYPDNWKQIENGELLRRAEAGGFDVLITNDKNIFSQQNLRARKLAIVVLPTNLRRQIMARVTDIVDTVRRIHHSQYMVIGLDGVRTGFDYRTHPASPLTMPALPPFRKYVHRDAAEAASISRTQT